MGEFITDLIINYWFWGISGLLVGASFGVRNMVRNGLPFPVSVIVATAAIYGGLIGARSLYILIYYPHMFYDDFIQAIAFWQSTGTWLGGPLVGILSGGIVLKLFRKPFWSNAGSFVPGLVLAHIICRIGCLVNGCCYGAPTSLPWAIYSEVLQTTVHPTPLYSMFAEIIVFMILQSLWHKKEYRIYLFPLYGVLLSTHRFFTEFFRGSDTLPWIIPGLRAFQTVCLFIFILSLSILILMKWKKHSRAVVTLMVITTTVLVFAANRGYVPFASPKGPVTSRQFIVLTRSVFKNTKALADWKQQKTQDGYSVVIQAWEKTPSTIDVKNQLHLIADTTTAFIMIVGDCDADTINPSVWGMPSIRSFLKDSNEFYTADVLFGDLDNDGSPEIPVGRLPVQTPESLKIQIAKIIQYSVKVNNSRNKGILVWPVDKDDFMMTSQMIVQSKNNRPENQPQLPTIELINTNSDTNRLFSNGRRDNFFLNRLALLPAISVVIGHGSYRSIGQEPSLCVEDLTQLKSKTPSGILFLLSCDSGKFNIGQNSGLSLAEAFISKPGGPVCVIGSAGTTTPLTSYILGDFMIRQDPNTYKTVGALMIKLQQRLLVHQNNPASDLVKAFHQLTKNTNTADNTGSQSIEPFMYNLLGDPSCPVVI